MKLKQEKGSVTLFVLVAMLLFCVILLLAYMNISNRNTEQMNNLRKIQSEYSQSQKSIDEIYENTVDTLEDENNI